VVPSRGRTNQTKNKWGKNKKTPRNLRVYRATNYARPWKLYPIKKSQGGGGENKDTGKRKKKV